jgi:MFS family permease
VSTVISARLKGAGSNTFRSLRTRNYRLYFTGQLISICGTWMQTIAQALLVLDLSHNNGLAAGTVIAIQFTPTLFLGAFAGVVADRFDKRMLMMLTQLLMAFNAVVLAALTLTDNVSLTVVYSIVLANGLVTVLDMPLRQSFVSEMVDDEDLANAVALNSAVFNGARIIGPAVAAGVLLFTGKGVCFLINAVSYFAVIICLALMRVDELNPPQRAPRARGQVREGIRYTWSQRQVRYTVMLVGLYGTVAFSFNVTLPLMARLVFHDEKTFSAMTVAMGIGSLIGALITAARKAPTARVLLIAAGGFALANIGAAASPSVGVMLPLLVLMGVCSITFLSTANALVQLSANPMMRGRVMALYSMVLLSGTPTGNLIAGWLANSIGPRWAVAFSGIGTALALLLLGSRVRDRKPPAEDDRSVLGARSRLGDEKVLDEEGAADEATMIGN